MSCPFKFVVMVPEASEAWKQNVILGIRGCHDNHFRTQAPKYGIRNLIKNWFLQMFHTVYYVDNCLDIIIN